MRRVGSFVRHSCQSLKKAERRVKVVVVLTAFMVLLVMGTALKAGTTQLWLFAHDACRTALMEKPRSPWKPERKEWWQKLCQLEHDMRQIGYDCRDRRWKGNRRVCFDFNLVPKQNCTVYSFGINYDFSFDDAMAEYGCTVFSFDPSMNVSDHQHADRVYFKQLGLSGSDSDRFVPRLDGYVKTYTKWRMRRLSSIMKDLGHAEGSLTILKVDIESYEWDVMEDLLSVPDLLTSIPQVLIEWHLFKDAPPRSRYDDLMFIYYTFKARGFHIFYWDSEGIDHNIENMRSQTETSWVNERFLVSRNP